MRTIINAAVALAVASGVPIPAFAIYTGQPALDPSLGPWVSSLWSDHGRCCDLADSVDPVWVSSDTAESGYALIISGQKIDVDKEAVHIFRENDATGLAEDVKNNIAGVPIAWVTMGTDTHQVPTYYVRCFLPGGAF